jgi:hypothetical protein
MIYILFILLVFFNNNLFYNISSLSKFGFTISFFFFMFNTVLVDLKSF